MALSEIDPKTRWKLFRSDFKRDWKKLPNLITLTRLAFCLLPGGLIIFNPNDISIRWIAAISFFIIVATDALDGYCARKFNQITELGKRLDPLVDKILVNITLIAISTAHPLMWIVTIIVIIRDLFVARILFGAVGRGVPVSVIQSGRVKMVIQSLAVILLFMPLSGFWEWVQLSAVLVAVGMTMTTWIDYRKKYGDQK